VKIYFQEKNMFLREIKSKNKKYLHIIESYREEGKVKHRSIAALGCIEDEKNAEQLKKIGQALLNYTSSAKLIDITQVEEKQRKNWGTVAVVAKLWKNFELGKLFGELIEERKIEFEFFSAVFLMLMDRLLEPKSKLKSYQEQKNYHGVIEIELHQLYRALDVLAESKEKIEEHIFEKNKTLWNMEVDLVLYDVTTFYFESVKADELREFGYGKDGNINEVQILFGLLVDIEGRPIGFDIFPGSSFEGHTIREAVKKLSKRFQVKRLILIADQGMFSNENLELIKKCDYQYIVGGRLKNRSKEIKTEVLDWSGYVELTSKNADKSDEKFKVKTIKLEEDDLICSWSKKRAQKDKADRERLVLKAKKIVEAKKGQIISRRGALKYIELDQNKIATKIDEKKILEDELWDGYYGLQSNAIDLSPQDILAYYHHLWRIEESFRIFKSHLETRPIFHWTAKRIKGHFVLSFIAFLLERTLEIQLKQNNIPYSPQLIRKALDELQYSVLFVQGKEFWLRSQVSGLANSILRTLKIKIPPNISPADSFSF
jgi:transposase